VVDDRTLDRQQRVLVRLVEQRGGQPVSFAELNDAGIEFPASVVSELELAGLPLEHCLLQVAGVSRPGVRLLATGPDEPAAEAGDTDEGPLRRRSFRLPELRLPDTGRWIAPAALGATVTLALVLVLAELGGGAPASNHHPAATRHAPTSVRAHRVSRTAPASHRTETGTPVAVSPALAAHLEARGHALLGEDQLGAAIPILRRAIAASGENAAKCSEPSSEACFTYAYALYDLGRALALDGHAASAVPILESRMQIDDQREVVAETLATVRQQAG